VGRLETLLDRHYDGFLFEDSSRQVDGSVIHAINVAINESSDDSYINVLDEKVAETVRHYNVAFCNEYPINTTDSNNKIPGVL